MPPKHAQQQHQNLRMEDLSEEDKQVLRDAHKNRHNPDHPAHEKHPNHHSFLKSIPNVSAAQRSLAPAQQSAATS